ncbi:MAG: LD-carboxypeptidase [Planctomycetota bacterium]
METTDGDAPRPTSYTIEIPEGVPRPMRIGSGKARGRLTGGNLSLVAALEGTPYAVDTRDAILMLEDVREAPYRIDRMLRQLKLAGKLDHLRGAVLGQFTKSSDREDNDEDDPWYLVNGVLRQYFEPLGVPVLMNYPVGHHKMNATMPLGGQVEINADTGELRVLGDD